MTVFEIPYTLDWKYGVSIETIKKDIEALEKLGATDIYIDAEENYGVPSISVYATLTRIETDEEFEKRYKEQQIRLENTKKFELKTFEEIKQKYNL